MSNVGDPLSMLVQLQDQCVDSGWWTRVYSSKDGVIAIVLILAGVLGVSKGVADPPH